MEWSVSSGEEVSEECSVDELLNRPSETEQSESIPNESSDYLDENVFSSQLFLREDNPDISSSSSSSSFSDSQMTSWYYLNGWIILYSLTIATALGIILLQVSHSLSSLTFLWSLVEFILLSCLVFSLTFMQFFIEVESTQESYQFDDAFQSQLDVGSETALESQTEQEQLPQTDQSQHPQTDQSKTEQHQTQTDQPQQIQLQACQSAVDEHHIYVPTFDHISRSSMEFESIRAMHLEAPTSSTPPSPPISPFISVMCSVTPSYWISRTLFVLLASWMFFGLASGIWKDTTSRSLHLFIVITLTTQIVFMTLLVFGALLNIIDTYFVRCWLGSQYDSQNGLSSDEIQANSLSLPFSQLVVSENPNLDCSICLQSFVPSDSIRLLKCTHYYHSSCLDTWLSQNKHCPLCRQSVDHRPSPSSNISNSDTFDLE